MKDIKRFYLQPWPGSSRFEVHGIGIREQMPACRVNRPQGTGDTLIMYFHTPVETGHDGLSVSLPRGSLMVWEPGEYQLYGHPRGFLHSWIHCAGSTLHQHLEAAGLAGRKPLSLPQPQARSFVRMLGDLFEEIAGNIPADPMITENLFENWTRDCARSLRDRRHEPPERLRLVREHMENNLTSPLRLEELARLAHWSQSHFSEMFRHYYGLSPIDHLIRRRMHHAAYLLQDVSLSVTDVAGRVGYEDIYHFSKLFKKHSGQSPRAFRASS